MCSPLGKCFTSFSLSFVYWMLPVLFVPLLVVAGAITVAQLSFASCCVSNDRSIHRHDDVNTDKTTLSGGKSSFPYGVNFVFRKRAKGVSSRTTRQNHGVLWKSSWTRASSRAFARYVWVVCERFKSRLVSLSLSLSAYMILICNTNTNIRLTQCPRWL